MLLLNNTQRTHLLLWVCILSTINELRTGTFDGKFCMEGGADC